MRTRRFKTLMALVLSPLGIAIIVLLLLVFERVRGQICLARYKRAQAAQGATLTVKEFTAGTPQGANGAPEVVGAAEALIDGLVMPYNPPPRMKLTDSGRAIVCFREPDWVTDKLTNRWETLAAELRTNEAALALIREGLAKTVFDHRLDYGGGPMMRIQHLTTAKSMSYWLQSGCQLALHEGQLDAGADWLVAEIRLQRFLSNDRIMISELVRLALAAIARADTWEALQAEGWTDEALGRIQKAWGEPGFIEPLARGLDGERIFASITFDRLRASNRETIDVLFGLSKLGFSGETETPAWKSTLENLPGGEAVSTFMREQVYCRIWRFAWLDQSECRYLKRVGDLTEITRAAAKSKSMTATAVDVDNFLARASASGGYDRLRFPSDLMSFAPTARAINRTMRMETERSLILAAIAIKRFSLKHGGPPESLAALVPVYLPAVPIDFMDGKPIRYRLNADGSTTLYSVGEDGRDEGGNARLQPKITGAKTFWDRKDCVWPAPALPEEVGAYRAKAFRSD